MGDAVSGDVYAIAAFVEKPDAARAAEYVESGDYLWNSGMFLFRADAYLEALQRHAPAIATAAREAHARATRDLDFIRIDAEAFAASPSDSIDYAVMERGDDAVVVPVDCGWSDIGAWSALWDVAARDGEGNASFGDVIDARDNYLQAGEQRMIAALGIRDLVVVDTADAFLVEHRDRVQGVTQLVDRLKTGARTEHLHHRKICGSWGGLLLARDGAGFQGQADGSQARCSIEPSMASPSRRTLDLGVRYRRSDLRRSRVRVACQPERLYPIGQHASSSQCRGCTC